MRTFVLTSKPEARPRKCDCTLYGPDGQWSLSIWQNRELAQPGDRYIHLKQGRRLAGVVAVGRIISEPYPDVFDVNRKLPGYFVDTESEGSIDPYTESYKILTREELIRFWPFEFNGALWAPRSSGALLPEPEATQIREAFLRRLNRQADPAELELSR
jgi:hypothetical protein